MKKIKFKLQSKYKLINDQKSAVDLLVNSVENNNKYNVLLGVTGSGKTFSIAKSIESLQKPTIIISHNKTLAAQLYQEFRDFFPDNAVSYFVSYYDYYQPEAYLPSTDTYIEKDSSINEYIDKLRLETTKNLMSRNDVIVVASVSAIYNIGNPENYLKQSYTIRLKDIFDYKKFINKLINLQYERNDYDFKRGTFRIRSGLIDIYPSYQDAGVRVEYSDKYITSISEIDTLTGKIINIYNDSYILFPAKHYITDSESNSDVLEKIKNDTKKHVSYLTNKGRLLEAQRIKQKVNYDLEMIQEIGYVKGIENYSRYFDRRDEGSTPYSLLHFFEYKFGNDWLFIADESHITFPQIRGMYAGDKSRKETLIEYGFRLPSCLDNRPLMFEEFMKIIPNFIALSATPDTWEIEKSKESGGVVAEQLIRPTGIPDPVVEIFSVDKQVEDVEKRIRKLPKGQRALITTLTKNSAEDLSNYLQEKGIKAQYLHSDIKTLERTDLLDELRRGNYDCLVGVNLLREGLDLPEVSLVAIFDADKQGFLRSRTSLIQTMGRAARHAQGKVVLYANSVTGSMHEALTEIGRRRIKQLEYNKLNNITPKNIEKPIREKLIDVKYEPDTYIDYEKNLDFESLTPQEKRKMISNIRKDMKKSADNMEFEKAARLRDLALSLENHF